VFSAHEVPPPPPLLPHPSPLSPSPPPPSLLLSFAPGGNFIEKSLPVPQHIYDCSAKGKIQDLLLQTKTFFYFIQLPQQRSTPQTTPSACKTCVAARWGAEAQAKCLLGVIV
jgi:hypothetical protein